MTGEHSEARAALEVLWRWRLLVLAIVLVIPAAVYGYVSQQPKVYEASTLLQVEAQPTDTDLLTGQARTPQDQALLVAAKLLTTSATAREAASVLGEPPESALLLLGSISASPDVDAGFITIKAQGPSPERATQIAAAFATAFVETRERQSDRRLSTTIARLQSLLDSTPDSEEDARRQLSEELQRLRTLRAAQGSNARIVEPAVASPVPIEPEVTRTVVLGAIVGLLLGFGILVPLRALDRRIRDPLELERLAGRPLLSVVPESALCSVPTSGLGEEAFHMLRASLTSFNIDRRVESVMISSPLIGEGKTTVAVNLARAMARAGRDVILVDADLRRPRVAEALDLEVDLGLAQVLLDEAELDAALADPHLDLSEDQLGLDEGGRLRVLAAGASVPNPSEMLGSQAMQDLLGRLTASSDLVIIDSPPLLAVSDTLPLLERVSGIVVVARVDKTPREALKHFVSIIENANGSILGVVAIGDTRNRPYGGYPYRAYAADPPSSNGSGRKGARKASREQGEAETKEGAKR